MKNLTSMTDYVLKNKLNSAQIGISHFQVEFINKTTSYANFLKQHLKIWMFVPCDLEGNVLDERLIENYETEFGLLSDYEKYNKEYYQAKERCLFEGFEFFQNDRNNPEFWCVKNSKSRIDDYEMEVKKKIIEDLVTYNLQLTPTALKQIGL